MPWNWQGRGDNSTEIGGSRGSYEEARVAHAWPKYEGDYLAKRLKEGKGKYAGPREKGAPDELAEFIYFDKISEDYKQEADECLKQEFSQWLLGQHEDNEKREIYKNGEGKPVRKAVFRYDNEIPGSKLQADWKPTWWGQKQLTHLPGVREYLTNMKVHSAANDFKMNLLAEFGPQDLEQAWVYFKHWVKGRPVAPEVTMSMPSVALPPGIFGDGQMLPPGMKSWREVAGDDKLKPSDEQLETAAENAASRDAKKIGASDDKNTIREMQEKIKFLTEQLDEVTNHGPKYSDTVDELHNTIADLKIQLKEAEESLSKIFTIDEDVEANLIDELIDELNMNTPPPDSQVQPLFDSPSLNLNTPLQLPIILDENTPPPSSHFRRMQRLTNTNTTPMDSSPLAPIQFDLDSSQASQPSQRLLTNRLPPPPPRRRGPDWEPPPPQRRSNRENAGQSAQIYTPPD